DPVDAGDYSRMTFSDPARIDNRWVALEPGTQWVQTGLADIGKGLEPHTVITTVTDLTKVVDGVRTTVVWDQDLSSGVLTESELYFVAQDDDGNVWLLGEYPEEYD